jgi:hypothetical protein
MDGIMPLDHSADLMRALVAKLYATITGQDQTVKTPRNKFVSWITPGIPFRPADFLFCSKGFIAETAEATNDRYTQAFTLSKLCDFVPDVNNQIIDDALQQTILASTQDTISSVYRDILKHSRVVDRELTPAEQEKVQRFRNQLATTKEVEDIMTGEKKQVTTPGPVTLAYTQKMNDYIDATDEYVNLLIDAQSAKGNDPEAIRRVARFNNSAKHLRKKVEAAEMDWVAQGFKNEYEQMNAYINQVTQKSMVLYKQDLQKKFDAALLTAASMGGSDFYLTFLLPGSFATSPGWNRFDYYSGDFDAHFEKDTSQWGGRGGLNLGLFSIGGSGGGSRTRTSQDQKASNFSATLEFTQVPIVRPWFDPGFFTMRGWTLDKLWDLNFSNKRVSDGGKGKADGKPEGRLVAYPILALFVRNVELRYAESKAHRDAMESQLSAGASVGWGPFSLGGSYSRGSERRNVESEWAGGAIRIPGMQLIGFINNLVPTCPNPNPEIKPEQFV